MELDYTVGGAYANTFIDTAEADEIIEDSGIDVDSLDAWLDLEDTAKELRLKAAAQLMGLLPLRGYRVYENQALCFPRSVQVEVEEIPDSVREAQALIAYMIIDKNLNSVGSQTSSGGETLLENALVKSVEVMGVMRVGLQNTLDAAAIKEQSSINKPLFYKMLRAYGAPIWLLLKPYLTQVRGGTTPDRTLVTPVLLESPG